MTSKEALENIKDNYPLFHPMVHPTNYKLIKESYDTLEQLVERDTPKKKVIRDDNISVISADCPKCKRVVDNGYKGCPYCLQRLDWVSENEKRNKRF